MQILNTFVAKNGSGGKRNRQARRRLERRNQGRTVCAEPKATRSDNVGVVETIVVSEPTLDLSLVWDEQLANKALKLLENSGKSQRAFASEHNFPESRIRSWKKKFGLLGVN